MYFVSAWKGIALNAVSCIFQERGDLMGSSKKRASIFDDDFEVTYEEDVPVMYELEEDKSNKKKKKTEEQGPSGWNVRNTGNSISYTAQRSRYNGPDEYEIYEEDGYEADNGYEEDDDYDEDSRQSRRNSDRDSRSSSGSRKKRAPRPTRLAAPIQKGGKAVYRVSQTLLRNLSVILIFAIIALLAYNFLRGSAPYGDIQNAVSTQTYTQMLAAYFAVAASFILFELFSALWAMTRVRVRDQYGSYKEDVGRGLFSFIFIYVCSYAAFLGYAWIPETYDVLRGIKGALDVFGSLHNLLFGLCAAGVVSCLLRKYSLSL